MNSPNPAVVVAAVFLTSVVALLTASIAFRRMYRYATSLAYNLILVAHAIGIALFCVLFTQWLTHGGRERVVPLLAQAAYLNTSQLYVQRCTLHAPETMILLAVTLTCGCGFVLMPTLATGNHSSSFLFQPLTLVLSGSGLWSAWSFRSPLRAALMSPRDNGAQFLVISYALLACHGLFVLAPLAALFEDVVSSYLAVFWLTMPANAFLACCRVYGVFWHSNRGRVYLEEHGAVFNKQLSREAESGCWADVAGPEKGAV